MTKNSFIKFFKRASVVSLVFFLVFLEFGCGTLASKSKGNDGGFKLFGDGIIPKKYNADIHVANNDPSEPISNTLPNTFQITFTEPLDWSQFQNKTKDFPITLVDNSNKDFYDPQQGVPLYFSPGTADGTDGRKHGVLLVTAHDIKKATKDITFNISSNLKSAAGNHYVGIGSPKFTIPNYNISESNSPLIIRFYKKSDFGSKVLSMKMVDGDASKIMLYFSTLVDFSTLYKRVGAIGNIVSLNVIVTDDKEPRKILKNIHLTDPIDGQDIIQTAQTSGSYLLLWQGDGPEGDSNVNQIPFKQGHTYKIVLTSDVQGLYGGQVRMNSQGEASTYSTSAVPLMATTGSDGKIISDPSKTIVLPNVYPIVNSLISIPFNKKKIGLSNKRKSDIKLANKKYPDQNIPIDVDCSGNNLEIIPLENLDVDPSENDYTLTVPGYNQKSGGLTLVDSGFLSGGDAIMSKVNSGANSELLYYLAADLKFEFKTITSGDSFSNSLNERGQHLIFSKAIVGGLTGSPIVFCGYTGGAWSVKEKIHGEWTVLANGEDYGGINDSDSDSPVSMVANGNMLYCAYITKNSDKNIKVFCVTIGKRSSIFTPITLTYNTPTIGNFGKFYSPKLTVVNSISSSDKYLYLTFINRITPAAFTSNLNDGICVYDAQIDSDPNTPITTLTYLLRKDDKSRRLNSISWPSEKICSGFSISEGSLKKLKKFNIIKHYGAKDSNGRLLVVFPFYSLSGCLNNISGSSSICGVVTNDAQNDWSGPFLIEDLTFSKNIATDLNHLCLPLNLTHYVLLDSGLSLKLEQYQNETATATANQILITSNLETPLPKYLGIGRGNPKNYTLSCYTNNSGWVGYFDKLTGSSQSAIHLNQIPIYVNPAHINYLSITNTFSSENGEQVFFVTTSDKDGKGIIKEISTSKLVKK